MSATRDRRGSTGRTTSRGGLRRSHGSGPSPVAVFALSFGAVLVIGVGVYLGLRGGSVEAEAPSVPPAPAPGVAAQRPGTAATAEPRPSGPSEVRLRNVPPQKDYGMRFKVEEAYDRFSGMTTYKVSGVPTHRSGDEAESSLTAFWMGEGESPRRAPQSVMVMFTSSSRDWIYLRSYQVAMLIDGQRTSLPAAEHDGRVTQRGVLEFVSWTMPTQTFIDMVNGARVELQVGSREFWIGRDDLVGLQALASRLPNVMGTK